MGGIAGIIGLARVNPRAVEAMTERLVHRGPDSDGLWTGLDGRVVLGHRRLAILDPSPRGRQPMCDPEGRAVVNFNGEIYNYVELAARLRAEGAQFESGTDTEVLLQGYLHWGDDVLRELNGMFAFALFDAARGRMLFARDRFAEKPLLFARGREFFAFASEYKALHALAEVSDETDDVRMMRFLHQPRRGLDDERATVFSDVCQLLGGEKLVLDTDTLEFQITPYWTPAPDADLARLGEEEAVERVRELLVDSVRLRLRSDVEVGSCLSGGLGSSALVCIARDLIGDDRPYHVFCGRFPGSADDEWRFAEQVVDKTHVVAHVVEPRPGDLLGQIETFVWMNELPVGSTSQYAQWCVFERAKEENVTVLLDGQGGDELLGGYEQYFPDYLTALRQSGQHRRARRERKAIRERYPLALPGLAQTAKRAMPERARAAAARLLGVGSDFAFGLMDGASVTGDSPPARTPDSSYHGLARTLCEGSFVAHLPTLLRYGDRNSMAHSREVRLPFCDHRLAELVLSLPPQYLMGEAQTKRLLRRAMRGIVPDGILSRWGKQGFLPPQDAWFREALLAPVKDLFHDPVFSNRGWWNVKWWRNAVRRFENGESHLAWVLWRPFIAEAWWEHFVKPIRTLPREPVLARRWLHLAPVRSAR